MTDSAVSTSAESTDAAELELGHPLLSFVIVLLAIGLLLLGIQYSGALHPRIVSNGSGGGTDAEGRESIEVEIRNDSFLPVRVDSLDWPTSGSGDVTLRIGPPGAGVVDRIDDGPLSKPFTPFTMEAGEVRFVVVVGHPTCPGSFSAHDLKVRVRTWAGLERTVRVDDGTEGLWFRRDHESYSSGEPSSCP